MNPTPRAITRSDPSKVEIHWDDGSCSRYTAAELRRLCPCAQCVDEVTGIRRLDPAGVPDDLTQQGVELVGHYAITVRFSDGHWTGIYPFPMLKDNAPADRS